MVTVDPGDRIHFLDHGGAAWPDAVAGRAARARAAPDGLELDARSPDGSRSGRTPWPWTCVATACRMPRPRPAPTTRTCWPRTSSPWPRARASSTRPRPAPGSSWPGMGSEPSSRRGPRSSSVPAAAGLVLVDGGWERQEEATGADVDEFLRTLDEPPEVMASMRAFLRDRRGFDPSTWDADQEAAARATVVETRAGRVVPTTRPHALEASVRDDVPVRPAGDPGRPSTAPVVALVAADDDEGTRVAALASGFRGAGRRRSRRRSPRSCSRPRATT